MIDEDSENEGNEQVEKMQSLENERWKKGKSGRSLKSSYVKRPPISSASARIVDLTDDQIAYGIRPSTAICLDQIKALNEFNKALPKKKKNLAQPMFSATNIGHQNSIKRDIKKKTVELLTRYNPIGFVDDHYKPEKGVDPDSIEKFSMGTKVRSLSRESSRKRIEELRKHSGSLIGARKPVDFVDNVFNNNNPDQFNGPVSISLYNQANKGRPLTAPIEGPPKNNWLKKYEKL